MPVGAKLPAFLFVLISVATAVADAPTASPGHNVVWLAVGQRQAYPKHYGLLAWELYRQAWLIAARDGLGLQTRDQSLREWRDDPPADQLLTPSVAGKQITIRARSTADPQVLWTGELVGANFPPTYTAIVETAEKLSRGEFIDALRQHGYTGTSNDVNALAPGQLEAEGLVGHLDELSQLAAIRLTHETIRTDGESPQSLGMLVRAYANLSQLTRLQWSTENRVYAARALLYSQRMVAAEPDSAWALWHRAYARALVGIQGMALADLQRAALLPSPPPPKWVALLDPFCRYDANKLKDLIAADSSLSPLGAFLAFLTAENTGCQAAEMNLAQSALTANPQCLRLIDAMCDQTGPGMLNELSEQGPQIFSEMLGDQLEKMPAFPKSVIHQIHQLKRPGGNPTGRETICQSLIDQGAPDKDSGEPSWAAVARMIQEITFAQTRRRADLIACQWCVDASDFTTQVQPLVADHPYRSLIQAYGLMHHDDEPAVQTALAAVPRDNLTINAIPLWNVTDNVRHGSDAVFNSLWRNLDSTSFDLTQVPV